MFIFQTSKQKKRDLGVQIKNLNMIVKLIFVHKRKHNNKKLISFETWSFLNQGNKKKGT